MLCCLGLFAPAPARAASGTWITTNATADLNWSTVANWKDGIIADGAGASAIFTANLTNAITVTNDVARTIGGLNLTDSGSPYFGWILAGPATLTLEAATGVPTALVGNAASTVTAPLAGTQGFTKSGNNALRLEGTHPLSGWITNLANAINFTNGSVPNLTGLHLNAGTAFNVRNGAAVGVSGGSVIIGPTAASASTCSVQAGGTLTVGAGGMLQLANMGVSGTANQNFNIAGTVTNDSALWAGRPARLNLNAGAVWVQNGPMTLAGQGGYAAIVTVNSGANFTYAGPSTLKLEPALNNGGFARLYLDGSTFTTAQGFERTIPSSTAIAQLTLANGASLKLAADVPQLTVGSVVVSNHTGGGIIDTAGHTTTISTPIAGGYDYFTKQGAGTLVLAAANAFPGDTVVSAGTLQLGDGVSRNGSLAGNLWIEAAVVFANPFNLTYAGALYSATTVGTLTKAGAGTLTLTGTGYYNGATAVNGGKLYVNGALSASSPVSVATNATLGGTGSVGDVAVAAGGTIEGGANGAGTLTVNHLTFADGTYLGVAASPTTAPLASTGILTAGSTVPVTIRLLNALTPGTTYHLLQFATLAGKGFFLPPARGLTLQTNGNFLDLAVGLDYDSVLWTGAASSEWSANPIPSPKNWQLLTSGAATDFRPADNLIFDDSTGNPTVDVSVTDVAPASLTFSNTTKSYVLHGSKSITSGTLTKQGNGTLAVHSTNSFPGSVALNGGVTTVPSLADTGVSSPLGAGANLSLDGGALAVTSPAAMNRGVTVHAGGGALLVNQPLTLSGIVDGAGVLAKNGTNALTLTSANSLAGVALNTGSLLVGNNAALGSGTVTLNGGTLSSDSAAARIMDNSFNFNGSFSLSDPVNSPPLTLGSSSRLVTLTANSTLHLPTAYGIQHVIDCPIDDGASAFTLTKTGPGDLRLNAVSSPWDGGLVIQEGRVGAPTGGYGTGPVTVFSGAQANISGYPATFDNVFYLAGIGPLEGSYHKGAIVINYTATISALGSIVLTDHARLSSDANATTLAAPISETGGSWALEIGGSDVGTTNGQLTLTGAGSHTGGTSIRNHRLGAGNVNVFGSGPVDIQPYGQAYLTVAGGDYTNTFHLAGNGWVEAAGQLGALRLSGANLVSGPVNLTTNSRITAYASSGTIAGPIHETGGAWKLEIGGRGLSGSAGTTTLSGTNTYTGGTEIRAGVAVAGSSAAFGTGSILVDEGSLTTAATRLEINPDVTLTNDITLDSTAATAFLGQITAVGGGVSTVTGNITVTTNAGNGGHFAGDATPSTLRLLGPILTPTGISPLARVGTVEVGGGGTYTQFSVGEGTLRLVADQGLNPASVLWLGISAASVFDLNGHAQTLAGLGGTAAASVLNGGASPVTLTLDLAGTNTFGGVLQDGASTMSLAKQGAGTLILTNANTYTGSTVVSGGVLRVDGALAGGNVTVAAGTLGGSGTIGGPVAVQSAGTLAPGASIGTLTFNGNLGLAGTTVIEVDKTTGTQDQIVVLGELAYGGTLHAVNVGGSLNVGDSFPIASAGSHTGNFTAVTGSPGGGKAWSFDPATGLLSVIQGSVNPDPTNLTAVVSGSNLNLSWPADHTGWRLEVQTNLLNIGISTNWSTWPGSDQTNAVSVPINPANPAVFMRLVYP